MPDDLYRMTLWWGPGALLLVILAYGSLRLARLWIEESMNAKRHQMEGVFDMAKQYLEQFVKAQRSQADALSRLASSVERSDSRDTLEHQQMLIALKAMHQDIERLGERSRGVVE